jgi:hypothetical protein
MSRCLKESEFCDRECDRTTKTEKLVNPHQKWRALRDDLRTLGSIDLPNWVHSSNNSVENPARYLVWPKFSESAASLKLRGSTQADAIRQ